MRLGNIADTLGRKLSMQGGGRTQMGAFKVAEEEEFKVAEEEDSEVGQGDV